MNRLDVKTSKLPLVLSIIIGLFFVPMGLLMLVNGVLKGFNVVPVGIGLMLLISFAAVVLLVRRGQSRSVKYFSDEGLTRNDGQGFRWPDLTNVVNQVRRSPGGRKTIWRTEIRFQSGEAAWIIPSKVSNYTQVSEFVRALPCEQTETVVGML